MKNYHDCRILIVDDNCELQEMLRTILNREGFHRIRQAFDCREAMSLFHSVSPELIILDVMLPDGDGFTLMREIRTASDVPVLFLSARDEDNDRLLGLGLGADDYITKPFLPRELLLRLTAILKRTWFPASPQAKDFLPAVIGSRTINLDSASVTHGDAMVSLTAKELILLRKLLDHRGNIVTFNALSQAVWNDDYYGYENTLMVHIRRLREKIEEDPSSPRYLLTVRGLGYKLQKEK